MRLFFDVIVLLDILPIRDGEDEPPNRSQDEAALHNAARAQWQNAGQLEKNEDDERDGTADIAPAESRRGYAVHPFIGRHVHQGAVIKNIRSGKTNHR